MDIFNRPPGISEDTLQYALYPPAEYADKVSVASLAALIEAYIKELLPHFIWHRDAFELKIVRDDNHKDSIHEERKEDKWMLEGRVRVGDSVDDEWCIVWLLREVSKKWDMAITVFDSDGEFLLIEAADYLPKWVTPTNSENRVWMYGGNLHLIPLSYQSNPSLKPKRRRRLPGNEGSEDEGFIDSDDDVWLSVRDALKAVRSENYTGASKEVQEAVWKRISGYPAAARQHMHVVKAFIPIDIAKALSREPSLIQRAVETFYTRDAIQLRAAHKMSRFPPQASVLSPVRLTRTAYAQLVGQKFHPPKIFGRFKEHEGSPERKWNDIGMKIACGFEMLYQESKSGLGGTDVDTQKASTEARKDALRRNPEYVEYIRKLKETGYFKEELEGSHLWNGLEDRAAEVFVNSRREDDASRPSFAALVNSAIAQAGDNPTLPAWEEESDEWLNVDAETFDEKLEEMMRPKGRGPGDKQDVMDVDLPNATDEEENRAAQAQADKLHNLAKRVENFVEGEGTLEGAVFEDESMSEDEQLSEFSEEEFPSDQEDINKHVDKEDSSAKATRQEAMDKLVPALDPADYGKMPAEFYSNSQRIAPVTVEDDMGEDVVEHAPSSQKIMVQDDMGAGLTGQKSVASESFSHRLKPIRRPILPRDDFDGVDSDDETDEEAVEDEEEEEDRPQVVGEVEIDMGAEQEEFLEFSRTALGISDDMWNDILQERRGRGAYAPKGIANKQVEPKATKSDPTSKNPNEDLSSGTRQAKSGPRPNANPNLDSFEAVMEAMEAELNKARLAKNLSRKPGSAASVSRAKVYETSLSSSSAKGKAKATQETDDIAEDEDIEAAMDAELMAALEREEGDSGDEEPMDYGMIKNFLESFKSQQGLAGPVSSLAGRLQPGWLPRDDV